MLAGLDIVRNPNNLEKYTAIQKRPATNQYRPPAIITADVLVVQQMLVISCK